MCMQDFLAQHVPRDAAACTYLAKEDELKDVPVEGYADVDVLQYVRHCYSLVSCCALVCLRLGYLCKMGTWEVSLLIVRMSRTQGRVSGRCGLRCLTYVRSEAVSRKCDGEAKDERQERSHCMQTVARVMKCMTLTFSFRHSVWVSGAGILMAHRARIVLKVPCVSSCRNEHG